MKPLHELKKFTEGYSYVGGTDEVGRGSLAGPVVAAAVLFSPGSLTSGVQELLVDVADSKTLSEQKREHLALLITDHVAAWSVGVVSPMVIDTINIHQTSLRAMSIATRKANAQLENVFMFVDGKFTMPDEVVPQQSVIGGDAKIFSVACASILAKVYRDALMKRLHKKVPQYNFKKHKGYATLEHRNALEKFGVSAFHRRSFCKKFL